MRSLHTQNTHKGWHLHLRDDPQWQQHLGDHMQTIFAKPRPSGGVLRMAALRLQLRRRCKHTPWQPFTHAELLLTSHKWGNNKSTGPDGISHEAARALLADPAWGGRIAYLLNDMFYTAKVPEAIDKGVTVLLPKVPHPLQWGDTRPITLSSTILKWASQLLLHRAGGCIRGGSALQWARAGRQGVELIATIRRVTQMARDWGVGTWLVKLDIRKAFDSVWQHSMGELVAAKVGGVGSERAPVPEHGGNTHGRRSFGWKSWRRGPLTWQWQMPSPRCPKPMASRQGSPDSPDLFGAIVARDLQTAIAQAPSQPVDPQGGPPPPRTGGSFLDDTYLWSQNRAHLQKVLTNLEGELREDGLHIHPTKTAILYSQPTGGGTFNIGGETIACCDHKTVISTLGSPITFGEQTAAIIAEMQRRSRNAFRKHKPILTARTSMHSRAIAHVTLVRNAGLYACESWPPHHRILKGANSQQIQHYREMLHIHKHPSEDWATWNSRSLRQARLYMHREKLGRWSTYILHRIWSLWGHMARGGEEVEAMVAWKNLAFWRGGTAKAQEPTSLARSEIQPRRGRRKGP